ncbi:MAG: tRNA 2-selenouridine(34) synthase MnmH [Flavobacteriales bacterium]
MRTLGIEAFLENKERVPLLDARSPSEFEKGHIPAAHSFPLFSDEERVEVGCTYKQEGRQSAIKTGLRLVGPKMERFIEAAESFGTDRLLMHCWRGGMRSESLACLLEFYGFQVNLLEGGYKSFRRALLDYFEQPMDLRVLTGPTGSKKTKLLYELRSQGEQVIDLEGLARHQGSSFGTQATDGQPTTEQFQNELFEAFRNLDRERPIWIEDESFKIGQVHLVERLYHQKEAAPHYHIEIPWEERVRGLVTDYGGMPKARLIEATRRIQKRLGQKRAEAAIAHIERGELEQAVPLILAYYDKAYRKGIQKKADRIREKLEVNSADPGSIAEELLKKEKVL